MKNKLYLYHLFYGLYYFVGIAFTTLWAENRRERKKWYPHKNRKLKPKLYAHRVDRSDQTVWSVILKFVRKGPQTGAGNKTIFNSKRTRIDGLEKKIKILRIKTVVFVAMCSEEKLKNFSVLTFREYNICQTSNLTHVLHETFGDTLLLLYYPKMGLVYVREEEK